MMMLLLLLLMMMMVMMFLTTIVHDDDDFDGDKVEFEMFSKKEMMMMMKRPVIAIIYFPALDLSRYGCSRRSTPLHVSALEGHFEVSKLLVEFKADLSVVDK